MSRAPPPTLALLPWGNVIEDYLDPIGLSLERFCNEMSGGWLFNYVSALRLRGWRVVIVCCSREVRTTTRLQHKETDAPVYALPAWTPYRQLTARMRTPYGWTIKDSFGRVRRPLWPFAEAVRLIVPYFATPPFSLARVLRAEHCAAIMVQEYEYARFDVCVALGPLLRIPVFATFQGGDCHGSRLETRLRPLAFKGCRGVVVASRAEVARIQEKYRLPPEKIAYIGNPIDLDTWTPEPREEARQALGLPRDARIAMWHGRVDIHQKGLDHLIAAWRKVVSSRPGRDLRLLLVGGGVDNDRLSALIEEDPVPGLHWFRDYIVDRGQLRRLLSAGDVHVMTSRVEGFPVAALEAMACGLPIVASDIHGLRDILADGEEAGGLLVPSQDPEATAAALLRLLDSPELRARLGRRARRTVETRFSLAAVGGALADFLEARIEGGAELQMERSTAEQFKRLS